MSPTMTSRCLAREKATLDRRTSLKNPIEPQLLLRVKPKMTVSCSPPWNESTDATLDTARS